MRYDRQDSIKNVNTVCLMPNIQSEVPITHIYVYPCGDKSALWRCDTLSSKRPHTLLLFRNISILFCGLWTKINFQHHSQANQSQISPSHNMYVEQKQTGTTGMTTKGNAELANCMNEIYLNVYYCVYFYFLYKAQYCCEF